VLNLSDLLNLYVHFQFISVFFTGSNELATSFKNVYSVVIFRYTSLFYYMRECVCVYRHGDLRYGFSSVILQFKKKVFGNVQWFYFIKVFVNIQ